MGRLFAGNLLIAFVTNATSTGPPLSAGKLLVAFVTNARSTGPHAFSVFSFI